jgi:hypothetical protein
VDNSLALLSFTSCLSVVSRCFNPILKPHTSLGVLLEMPQANAISKLYISSILTLIRSHDLLKTLLLVQFFFSNRFIPF